MKVRYFAWLKNITNTDCEDILDNSVTDINSLKKFLCNKYPKLNEHILKEDIIRIAINLEYTSNNIELVSSDEVALFPPVSGG
tara:strand:- start:392 stop:640 length:249 start_codon:yes stop_codon:yes gene_type:complete